MHEQDKLQATNKKQGKFKNEKHMLNGKSSGKYENRQRLQAIVCFFWWKEKKSIGMEWLKKIKCLQLIVCQLPVAKMGANSVYTIHYTMSNGNFLKSIPPGIIWI